MTGLNGYNAWLCGDREALAGTVEAYNKKLIYYIGSVLHDYVAAEDLASETFLRLLIKKPKFGEEGQLASWLYKTARNLAFDAHRRGKYEDADAEIPESADEEELLGVVLQNERQKMLHEAMKGLKEEYREVLLLLYFSELSYEEAGRAMKKNQAQIRNLAYRAKQSLKEKLERMGFTYEE